MSANKGLLIGCGIAAVAALILIGLVVAGVVYLSQDIKGVSVSIDSPLDVKLGETFEMVVNVRNERKKRALSLSDIDISEDYLDSFAVISTEPAAKSHMHVPLDNSMSYTFNTRIAPGTTKAFTFTLRAEKIGFFRGDVDVCEGMRFITASAQTVVKE
jgi:hypothetical protein